MIEPIDSIASQGLAITGPINPGYEEILTPDALSFVEMLCRRFEPTRSSLLLRRTETQAAIDAGGYPDFPTETAHIRRDEWHVAAIPRNLQDRRVEITGPVDRKMMINAFNSGANVFMADFEDAHSPTWENTIQGQINCRDAVNGTIAYTSPEGRRYELNDQIATLMVRPRGWHLPEKHVLLDGRPISASLFDFGLYFFHNARRLLERGTGPYFYLPKLEHYLEARLWNHVFLFSQEALGIPRGSIRATVLIETILASFQMDEILWELREHSAGLNCGRWDYIFSAIKKFRNDPHFVMPDRGQVTMTQHMMRSYSLLCIQVCHRRGIHAMGGMSAYIPVRSDANASDRAIEQVVADKRREAGDGHDGTWVAHPALVPVARQVFDEMMPEPNQISRRRDDLHITAADLIRVPEGAITETGLRQNINVAIRYIESWLRGVGAAAINNLMEDAATAEISRAQVWQWVYHGRKLVDGRTVTTELVRGIMDEELQRIQSHMGPEGFQSGEFERASQLFDAIALGENFVDFLTIPGYAYLP